MPVVSTFRRRGASASYAPNPSGEVTRRSFQEVAQRAAERTAEDRQNEAQDRARIDSMLDREEVAAQREAAKQQKADAKAADMFAKREFNAAKDAAEAKYMAEGRPTYIDSSGMVRPKVDDATWEKQKQAKEAASKAQSDIALSKRGLQATERAIGEVDDTWATAHKAASQKAKEASRLAAQAKADDAPNAEELKKAARIAKDELDQVANGRLEWDQGKRDNRGKVNSERARLDIAGDTVRDIKEGRIQPPAGGILTQPDPTIPPDAPGPQPNEWTGKQFRPRNGAGEVIQPPAAPQPGMADLKTNENYTEVQPGAQAATPPQVTPPASAPQAPEPQAAEMFQKRVQDFNQKAAAHDAQMEAVNAPVDKAIADAQAKIGAPPITTLVDGTPVISSALVNEFPEDAQKLNKTIIEAQKAAQLLNTNAQALQEEQTQIEQQAAQLDAAAKTERQAALDERSRTLKALNLDPESQTKVEALDRVFDQMVEAMPTDEARQMLNESYHRERAKVINAASVKRSPADLKRDDEEELNAKAPADAVETSPDNLDESLKGAKDKPVYIGSHLNTRVDAETARAAPTGPGVIQQSQMSAAIDAAKRQREEDAKRAPDIARERGTTEKQWERKLQTLVAEPTTATHETLADAIEDFRQGKISNHTLDAVFKASGAKGTGVEAYKEAEEYRKQVEKAEEDVKKIAKGSDKWFHGAEGADPRATREFKEKLKRARNYQDLEAAPNLEVRALLEDGSDILFEAADEKEAQHIRDDLQKRGEYEGKKIARVIEPSKVFGEERAAVKAVRDAVQPQVDAIDKKYEDIIPATITDPAERAAIKQRAILRAMSEVPRTLGEMGKDPKFWATKIPFIGDAVTINALARPAAVAAKLERIENGSGEKVTQEEVAVLQETLIEMERPNTFAAGTLSIGTDSAKFATELAATWGVYTAAKKATIKAVELGLQKLLTKEGRALALKAATKYGARYGAENFGMKEGRAVAARVIARKYLGTSLEKSLAVRAGAGLVGVAAQTPFASAGRMAEKYVRDYTTEGVAINPDEHDRLVAQLDKSERRGPWERLSNSYLDSFVENSSEMFGEFMRASGMSRALANAGRKALSKVPEKIRAAVVKNALVRNLAKLNTHLSKGGIRTFFRRGRIGSIPEEITEEYVGAIGHTALNNEDLRLPTMEENAQLALSMLVPGLGSMYSQYRDNRKQARAEAEQQAKDKLQRTADLAASQAELDRAAVDPQMDPAVVQRARVLAKIAQGTPMDRLDEHELAPIGMQRTDTGEVKEATGKNARPPAVKMINGKPVIRETELDMLSQHFPETAATVSMTEDEARQKAMGKAEVVTESEEELAPEAPPAPVSIDSLIQDYDQSGGTRVRGTREQIERVAKDHGITVEDSTPVGEIVRQLKEKKQPTVKTQPATQPKQSNETMGQVLTRLRKDGLTDGEIQAHPDFLAARQRATKPPTSTNAKPAPVTHLATDELIEDQKKKDAPVQPTTNVIHDKPALQIGHAKEGDHVAEAGYAYRTISQSELDDARRRGAFHAPEKSRGGRKGVKHWDRGGGGRFYSSESLKRGKQLVIRVKNSDIKADAAVKIEHVEVLDPDTWQASPANVPQNSSKQPVPAQQQQPKENTTGKGVRSTDFWSARTDKGTVVSIPAGEAKTRAQAEAALAAKVPAGEVLDSDSIQAPVVVPPPATQSVTAKVVAVGMAAIAKERDPKRRVKFAAQLKLLVDALGKVESKFTSISIDENIPGSGLIVDFEKAELHIDPVQVISVMNRRSGKDAAQWLDSALDEEFKHSVSIQLEKDDPEGFGTDLREWWAALPQELKQRSRDIYFGKYEEVTGERREFQSDHEAMHEAWRQFWTVKEFRELTEQALNTDSSKKLRKLIESFIKALRELLKGIHPKLKELGDRLLAQAEAKAAELSGETKASPPTAASEPTPPALKTGDKVTTALGSEATIDFVKGGSASITITKSGHPTEPVGASGIVSLSSLKPPTVDTAAHEAATSPKNNLPEPSNAQKEAGNYQKGHTTIGGVEISIENPAGSHRRPEWPVLKSHYGYVLGTEGKDGDHLDVFIRPGTPQDWSGPVFVVNQTKPDGSFDEHKVMVGFNGRGPAKKAYAENYTKGWKVGTITELSWTDFRQWIKDGDLTKPLHPAGMEAKHASKADELEAEAARQKDPKIAERLRAKAAALRRTEQPAKSDESPTPEPPSVTPEAASVTPEAPKADTTSIKFTSKKSAETWMRENGIERGKITQIDQHGELFSLEVPKGEYKLPRAWYKLEDEWRFTTAADPDNGFGLQGPYSRQYVQDVTGRDPKDLAREERETIKKADAPPAAPRTREEMQATFAQFRRGLRKAIGKKDWPEVLRQVEAFKKHYETTSDPWPDSWSEWERAGEDAKRRLGQTPDLVEPITKPLAPKAEEPPPPAQDPTVGAEEIGKTTNGQTAWRDGQGLFVVADGKRVPIAQQQVAQWNKPKAEPPPPPVSAPAPKSKADGPAISPDTEQALRDAAEGLFTAPDADRLSTAPDAPEAQKGLPPAKIGAFVNVASKLIADGVKTPQDLAAVLERTFGGKLRPYSQAIWNTFGVVDLSLMGTHDWPAVYSGLANEQKQPESVPPTDETLVPRSDSAESGDAEGSGGAGTGGSKSGGRVGSDKPETTPPVGGGGNTAPKGGGSRGGRGSRPGKGKGGRNDAPERPGDTGDVRDDESSPPVAATENYTITDADHIGESFEPKQKYADNLAAIRLVKKLEADNRKPTVAEQKVLLRYVGWGGIKGAFDESHKQWGKEAKELRELLTDDEYADARRSTMDAHYTSPTVIRHGIWGALRRFGFHGGKMLEGGFGIGHMLGFMPGELRGTSSYLGIEKDSITARIAAFLYPRAKVYHMGFEEAPVERDHFDGAAGNPPFGQQQLFDKAFKEESKFSIHNFFIAKQLAALRPGGVAAFVVSRYFLDALDPSAREYIASKAQFLGAIRLPNTAFKGNANTEVTTDIVYFKRVDDGAQTNKDWTKSERKQDDEGNAYSLSRWIQAHPEMVLGTIATDGSMHPGSAEVTVHPRPAQDLAQDLAQAVERLPANVYDIVDAETEERLTTPESLPVPDGVKVGAFFVAEDGTLRKRTPDYNMERMSAPVETDERTTKRIKGLVAVRDAFNRLVAAELKNNHSEAQLDHLRDELNRAYDSFINDKEKWGLLNQQANRRAFYADPQAARLLGLETDYDPGISAGVAKKRGVEARKPSARKSDIFSRRVNVPYAEITKVGTAKEALTVSLNQRGEADMDYMSELSGKGREELVNDLEGLIFETPDGQWQVKDQYLSGNVRQKLKDAEEAATRDGRFRANVEALKAVQPPDLAPHQITVTPGAPWIVGEILSDFAEALTGETPHVVVYRPGDGGWTFSHPDNSIESKQTWGTPALNFGELFEKILNNKSIVVYNPRSRNEPQTINAEATATAQQRAAAIKERWKSWVFEDADRREALTKIYNDRYNVYVDPKYDGSHLAFPGMSNGVTLRKHQKDCVWRIMTDLTVMLDHVVGAGKTFAGIAAFMELRRIGRVRKPLFAVPNHLVTQWRDDFVKLYPNANILFARPSDFAKAKRQQLFAKILTGEYDAVIVGHSSLKKIGMSVEIETKLLNDALNEIMATLRALSEAEGRGGTRAQTNLERQAETIRTKLAKLAARTGDRDEVATFEELGIDGLFVDEAHEFKNLYYTTSMQNVAGLGNAAGSAKAFDLYLKTRYMRQRYGGKAPIVFATGTPISNSLVEMFTMQRYLQPDVLEAQGITTLDAWARLFGQVEQVYEVDPTGTGMRLATRLAKFQNAGDLAMAYRTVADVITQKDLMRQAEEEGKRFPIPKVKGGKPQIFAVPRSKDQEDYFGIETQIMNGDEPAVDAEGFPITEYPPGTINWRVDNMPDDPREDNMLKLTNDARKAALDMRLIDPSYKDQPESKVNKAASNILAINKKWQKDKGTQLVFCDLSIPSSAKGKAKKKAEEKLAQVFWIQSDGGIEKVDGAEVELPNHPDIKVFAYKTPMGRWRVIERTSGRVIETAKAKGTAVSLADHRITMAGVDVFMSRAEADRPDAEMLAAFLAEQEAAAAEGEGDESADVADDSETAVTADELLAEQSSFSVYDDLKAKLIAVGMAESEVAFIHDFDSPDKKADLFARMNRGEVRVLIGSTPKLGAGTNVQRQLVALHHLDAPWRPSDLEQREGRIIRQGNKFYEADPDGFEVEVMRYATELTYDTRMWQIIEHKASSIEGFRKADRFTRTIEDVSGEAANAAEMKAASSGDPRIQREIQLRGDITKLQNLYDGWRSNKHRLESDVRYWRKEPERAAATRAEYEPMIAARQPKGEEFEYELPSKKVLTKKDDIVEPIATLIKGVKPRDGVVVGKYRGYTVVGSHYTQRGQVWIDFSLAPSGTGSGMLRNVTSFKGDEPISGVGLIQRFDNYLDAFDAKIKEAEDSVPGALKHADELESAIEPEFKDLKKLEDMRAEHTALRSDLMQSRGQRRQQPPDANNRLSTPPDADVPERPHVPVAFTRWQEFDAGGAQFQADVLDAAWRPFYVGRKSFDLTNSQIAQEWREEMADPESERIADAIRELRKNPVDWVPFDVEREATLDSVLHQLWHRFDAEGELTINDLVNEVDALIPEHDDPRAADLQDAVDAFRKEQEDDRALAGRGDMDAAEEAFVSAFKSAMRKKTKGLNSAPDAVDADQDAAYLDAVERGDMETAQRMVDAANKRVRSEIKVERIRNGKYKITRTEDGRVFNILQHEPVGWIIEDAETFKTDRGKTLDALKSDIQFGWTPLTRKSADPVTRDANGNVIPLSQRFNPAKSSILHSAPDAPDVIRGRSPEVQQAIRDRLAGKITQEAFDRIVQANNPVTPLASAPKPATDAEMLDRDNGVKSTSREKVGQGKTIKAGTKVALRTDLPWKLKTGKAAVVVHEAGAKPGHVLAFEGTGRIINPRFLGSQKTAAAIGQGGARSPFAAVQGDWSADQSIPQDVMTWTQVGFDPTRHSYYYDKASRLPVVGGAEAIQIGNTVFVRQPTFGDLRDVLYTAPDADESDEQAIERAQAALDSDLPTDEDIRNLMEFHGLEVPGEFTIGNPEIANPGGDDQTRRANDVGREIYEDTLLQKQKFNDWEEAGRKMAAEDPRGVERAIREAYENGAGELPDSVLTRAAIHHNRKLMGDALASGDDAKLREAMGFAIAYYGVGTELARAMRARADTTKTRRERFEDFLMETIGNPHRAEQRIDLEALPRAADKARTIERITKELQEAKKRGDTEEVKRKTVEKAREDKKQTREDLAAQIAKTQRDQVAKALKKEGLTIEDLLDNRVEMRLKFGRLVMDAMGKRDPQREKAIDLMVHGWPTREIVRATKMTEADVEALRTELRGRPQALREALAKAIQRGVDITKIAGNILSAAPDASGGMSWEDALAEADRVLDKLIPTSREADNARWRKVRRVRPGDQSADAALQRTIGALASPTKPKAKVSEIQTLIRLHRKKEGVKDFVKKAIALGADPDVAREADAAIEAERARKVKPVVDVDLDVEYVPFDMSDNKQVYRVMRTLGGTVKGAADVVQEIWINSILSGLQTHAVNIVGNTVSAAWDLTIQRAGEAMFSLLLPKNANLESLAGGGAVGTASFGEFRHMLSGLLPGIVQGAQMAATAWSTEHDQFEKTWLKQDLEEDIDRHGPVGAIGGKFGRFVRVPGRALRFADSFFKMAIARIEVGAQAYRIGRAKGLKGEELKKWISEEVKTPGSASWVRAANKATELTFQDDSSAARVAGLFTKGPGMIAKMAEGQALSAAKRGEIDKARGWITFSKWAHVVQTVMRFIFPFVRTPVNILRMGLRKTPAGTIPLVYNLTKGLIGAVKGQGFFNKYAASLMARHLTEQALAWTAFYFLYGLSEGGPDDDKPGWLMVGGRPYSRDVGTGDADLARRTYGGTYMLVHRNSSGVIDTRVPFGRIEPLATALGSMVDALSQIKRYWSNREKMGGGVEASKSIAHGVISNLVGQAQDKTFLRGFSDVGAMLFDVQDPNSSGSGAGTKFLTNIAAGFVPNLGKQGVRSLDDYERNYKQATWSHSFWPDGKAANPLVDAFGKDVTKSGSKWLRLFWPTPSNINANPAEPTDQMVRQWNLTHPQNLPGDNKSEDSRYFIQRPDKGDYKVKENGKERPMTLPEMRTFDQTAGRNLSTLQQYLTRPLATRASFADMLKLQKNLTKARSDAGKTVARAAAPPATAVAPAAPTRRASTAEVLDKLLGKGK